MNFDNLKKVPPLDNKAPVIHSKDKLWSDVFEAAANKLEGRQETALCYAIRAVANRCQSDRMGEYVLGLLGDYVFVRGWLSFVNGALKAQAVDLYAYRAAWARHLAAQFRAKGL